MSKSPNATFEQIRDTLAGAKRIGVASHVRPDGDAYGCTIAMALHLRAPPAAGGGVATPPSARSRAAA